MSMERLVHWASTLRAEWPFKLRLRLWPITMIALFVACLLTGLAVVATTHMTRVQVCRVAAVRAGRKPAPNRVGAAVAGRGGLVNASPY